jgi:hypothetical protein
MYSQQYWYISAENTDAKSGKIELGFDGPYDTEKDAEAAGFQIFPGQMFKKHQYRTRDKAKATSMWKHDRAKTVGAFQALKPVHHPDKRNVTNGHVSH